MDGPDVDKFFEELKDLRKIHYSPNGPKMISLIEDYITSGRVHIDAKLPGSQIETLRYIVGHGYPEVTDHLIKLGSNPNAQGAIKYTALHLLIVAYFQDMDKVLEEIDILVNNEADLSLRDDDNLMPLDSGLFLAITMPEDYLSDNALTLKLNKLIGKCQSELCESTLKEAINNRHYDNKPYTPEQLERLKVIYDCVRKGEPIPDINNFRGRAFQIWDL
ncbi:MAG: hypothetical protein C5B47_03300 [Verrucomicrobia bacterium]|nr:MAG: hypothetical protein C5B47_03300 [Verrucomicrobiota bacterium]